MTLLAIKDFTRPDVIFFSGWAVGVLWAIAIQWLIHRMDR